MKPLTSSHTTHLEVWTARDCLRNHATAIDRLHTSQGVPVTARRPWLQCWLRANATFRPLVVAVLRGRDGLQACAPLAWTRRNGITTVVAIGDAVSDYVRFPAVNDRAAIELASGISRVLARMRRPWHLHVRQLPIGDPVAQGLRSQLRHARLLAGWSAPRTPIGVSRDLVTYFSRNHRRAVRKQRNRLAQAGFAPRLERRTDPRAVAETLDAVVAIAARREAEIAGRSRLEDADFEAFFRAVVVDHARRHELDLALLRAGDHIAAYSIGFVDGAVYRTWSAHHDPPWQAFSPGQMLDYMLVESLLADTSIDEIDWMMGMEAYKLRLATQIEPAEDLVAWSSPVIAAMTSTTRLARHHLEGRAAVDPAMANLLGLLRRGRTAIRRRLR